MFVYLTPYLGQDNQTRQHGQLSSEARFERRESASAPALQLRRRPAVDHGERLQVAGEEPSLGGEIGLYDHLASCNIVISMRE